jgi:hypothetical protein
MGCGGRPVTLAPDDPRHGTPNGYGNLRCRCEPCRTAWRDYVSGRGYNKADYLKRWRAKNHAVGRNARGQLYKRKPVA